MAGFYLPAFRKGSDFIIRKLTFHGKELAVTCQQLPAPVHKILQCRKSSAAVLAERLLRLAVFGTAVNDIDILQSELQHALVQKPGLLAITVEQGEMFVRTHDGQGNARQPPTGTDIQQMRCGDPRQDAQRSEEHTSEL